MAEARAAIEAAAPTCATPPEFTDADRDRARAVAEQLRGGAEVGAVDISRLAALSPDDAGRLVGDLATAGRTDALVEVVTSTPPQRYPIARLLRVAATLPLGLPARELIVRAVALAPALRLRSALDEVAEDPALAEVLAQVGQVRTALAAGPPYEWWRAHGAMAEPPGADEGMTGAAPPDEDDTQGGGEASPVNDTQRGGEASPVKRYPRVDVVSGTDNPDVVVVDQPFQVTIGLQARKDARLVASAALSLAATESVDLEAALLYDPTSIEVTGSPRATLKVTPLDQFPTVTLACTAKYGEELAPERRLGLQLLRDGQVVAVAWRTIVAVDSADRVASATVPPRRDVLLLDLDPLVGEGPPDLVVSICRADAGSATFVWTAYAADRSVAVPDLPRATTLDDDVAAFATQTRRSIEFSGGADQDFLDMVGRAVKIGRGVPAGIQDAIREVVAQPGRTSAPTVLLLTEELSVPWELAALDPRPSGAWGNGSPFLGAQVAIARWPLTEHEPRPRPRSAVEVHTAAVLKADYTDVARWSRLDSAVAEATEVAALFDPPADVVDPELWTVMDLFSGTPARDVVHVALHGKFDDQGDQEGIVLVKRSPAGGATAQFLTSTMLEGGDLSQGPFVFLNACQVASDERVLGDYAGFASTLLRIGATGVVAPLWNVRDDVAGSVARSFYAATYTATEPVSAAEALRAIRAGYTKAGVRAGDAGQDATLIAYQVFGHPRLQLRRQSNG